MSGLTDSEPNHLALGARSHRTDRTRHTYIHVLSYEGPKKMEAIPELFVFLWEKTGELNDAVLVKL